MSETRNSLTHSPGRLISKYLQQTRAGATISDIVRHLQQQPEARDQPPDALNKLVESILADATTLGFLERKGSRFICWIAKEACWGRRKRRKRSCRRRRRRRQSCSRSRRHRRQQRKCTCG